jgi:hypothetical protein
MSILETALEADLVLLCDSLAQPGLPLLQYWLTRLADPCVLALSHPAIEFSASTRVIDLFALSAFEDASELSGLDAVKSRILESKCQCCMIDSLSELASRFSLSGCLELIRTLLSNCRLILIVRMSR